MSEQVVPEVQIAAPEKKRSKKWSTKTRIEIGLLAVCLVLCPSALMISHMYTQEELNFVKTAAMPAGQALQEFGAYALDHDERHVSAITKIAQANPGVQIPWILSVAASSKLGDKVATGASIRTAMKSLSESGQFGFLKSILKPGASPFKSRYESDLTAEEESRLGECYQAILDMRGLGLDAQGFPENGGYYSGILRTTREYLGLKTQACVFE
ncbi:hypothetical protein ACYPKM_03910 [Pseudomonas aeruginosa]